MIRNPSGIRVATSRQTVSQGRPRGRHVRVSTTNNDASLWARKVSSGVLSMMQSSSGHVASMWSAWPLNFLRAAFGPCRVAQVRAHLFFWMRLRMISGSSGNFTISGRFRLIRSALILSIPVKKNE
ncbi:hypothetical protein ACVI1J_006637 [Bradyrhizobium diazoefficiens]